MDLSRIYRILSTSVDKDIFKNTLINAQSLSLETLINEISPILDKEILKIAQKEHLIPIGGQVKFETKINDISIIWNFYFQDKQNNLVEKSSQRIINGNAIDKNSFDYIKKNSPTYNIDAPQGGKNDLF